MGKVMKKKAAMKAMKAMKVMKKKAAMKAMKAMNAMKKKSVSKIARGVMAKVMVLRGSKAKTVGGLTSKDLYKNKNGRVEQEAERERQEVPMDPGLPEGSQGLEDYCLHCDQEGHTPVCEGEGVL